MAVIKSSSIPISNIRNFSIVAHIDHGKSTLADRLIEMCGGLEEREMKAQFLDSMDIERERGITIKAQTVRLKYVAEDSQWYIFNLIDTPGHVDFSYEVSRSLAACEGSILVVDSTQGVEAQTMANVHKAIDNNHEIIPVINKIDLPSADPDNVCQQIEEMIGISTENNVLISAKTGIGIKDVLEAVVKYIPAPKGSESSDLQALLVDSWYDIYLGIVILVRIKNGVLKKDMEIVMNSTGAQYKIDNVGIFTPHKEIMDELRAGEVGFFTASIKQVTDCKVGDTIMQHGKPTEILPGFKEVKPVVFCSMFPVNADQFNKLRQSLDKLHLNDASFTFVIESSNSLGHGFRCGFLGMLHLEIVQERLNREFDIDLVITAPSVLYKVYLKTSELLEIYNPVEMPETTTIEYVEEPWIKATIMLSSDCLGSVITLCNDRRGEQIDLSYNGSAAVLEYYLPLGDVVFDFNDRLKSISKGYASFDWEIYNYRRTEVVKLDILINGESLAALSCLLYKAHAERRAREICEQLKELIPRQQYKVAIQGSIGAKVIARETVNPYRKDVTAKLYGGDKTRKMKLVEKQKRGKKRLFNFANVEIPQSAFIEVLKLKK